MMMLPIDQVVPDILQEVVTASTTSASTLTNPTEEAAILNDLAEVSSDLTILFVPETIILRLTNVIGKILELTSDYLPDHTLRGDQIALTLPVLVSGLFLLIRSALPIIKAQFVELDHLDLEAYALCFQPVGVTLLQYKCMKAEGCFEWITCEAGTTLIDEQEYNEYTDCSIRGKDASDSMSPSDWKYVYWQFDGAVIRSFKDKVFGIIERTNGKHIDDPEAQGLLGDTRFLAIIEEEQFIRSGNPRQQSTKNSGDSNANNTSYETLHPIATIRIGPAGSRLLRIDGQMLLDLMDHDARLESSIRLLLLKSLKLKIGNLLLVQQDE